MKYYIWFDTDGRPLTKAWSYQDETERMAEEQRAPKAGAVLRTATKDEYKRLYHLGDDDFIEG